MQRLTSITQAIFFLVLLVSSANASHAAIWYVDNESTCTTSCGTSWGSEFDSIQSAVDAAAGNDEIWIKMGSYASPASPTITPQGPATGINIMNKNVALYGGFAGTETVRSQRDWANNVTIVTGNNITRSFYISDSTVRIDGLTIQDGYAGGPQPNYGGAGVWSHQNNLTIANCVLKNNTAFIEGGAINAYSDNDGTITLVNCIFFDNYSGGGQFSLQAVGGAIYKKNCNMNIINCTFVDNTAEAEAGAIYQYLGTTNIRNSIFWGNYAPFMEGVYSRSATLEFTYSCGQVSLSQTGNISSDPMLDSTLHLQPNSPCIDRGTANGAPSTDLDGISRPQGNGYDMGAFESPFTATTTTIPTTTTTIPPTLIELSNFDVTPANLKVIVQWSTESEIDNVGFNIYRSDSQDGDYVLVNDNLITAEGSPSEGASYEFIDLDVRNRNTYFYKIEDVDLNGVSTIHGPVSATPRLIYGFSQ